jgi:hypothetical protein
MRRYFGYKRLPVCSNHPQSSFPENIPQLLIEIGKYYRIMTMMMQSFSESGKNIDWNIQVN